MPPHIFPLTRPSSSRAANFNEIDTSDLLIERNHAAVEVPIRYRHRETGTPFESTKANF